MRKRIVHLLLGLFYEIYDVLNIPLLQTFFLVIRISSILIYMILSYIGFDGIAENIVRGLEPHVCCHMPLRLILSSLFHCVTLDTL